MELMTESDGRRRRSGQELRSFAETLVTRSSQIELSLKWLIRTVARSSAAAMTTPTRESGPGEGRQKAPLPRGTLSRDRSGDDVVGSGPLVCRTAI
ncbi:hypothetical protein SBD_1833 [Streptomyces bottropensis ATCC 25435]|uniref:Uncharacterized protein n=1 Tax=Streptomyces bottropensis ATCC 25435 TaxID=1054862 RepID=M3FUW9_9ACTN|nr:hypothetical protein SBD_1833 [Streptomyces bottropensis ATCC 25435]